MRKKPVCSSYFLLNKMQLIMQECVQVICSSEEEALKTIQDLGGLAY